MVGSLVDPVALLMPDAPAAELDLAERLTRALCLLSSDAVDSGSSSVRVQMGSARDELDQYHSGTVARVLQDLLIHVALPSLSAATYLILPAPRRGYAAAWSHAFALTTEEERRYLGLEVPVPGTQPLKMLGALVESLARHVHAEPLAELHAELWRIRCRWMESDGETQGESQTEAALEALLGQLSRERGARARSLRTAVLSDLVALQLDRGQVLAAWETVRRAGPTAQRPADARSPMDLLALAVKWMVGEPGMPALEAAFQKVSASGAAPAGWAEMLRHVKSKAPSAHPVSFSAGAARPSWTAEAASARRSWGASAVIVSLVRPNGRLDVVSTDVAPGLTEHVSAWVVRHRAALAERGTLEHEVGCRAAPLVLVATQDRPERAVRIAESSLVSRAAGVSFAQPMALVVEPILDGDGEPAGLLWMEFPTRQVPAGLHRAAAARALYVRHGVSQVESAKGPANPGGAMLAGMSAVGGVRARAAEVDVRAAWDRALSTLQIKTAERHWVAFHVEGDAPDQRLRVAADGGGARERLGAPLDGGAWAIRRSLRTGGAIRYGLDVEEEGDPEPVMLHRGAASGAALPLHRNGRVIAVLSLESVRRGDARAADVDRWFEALQSSGPLVEATILSAVDRRGFDGGFAVSEDDPEFLREHEALCSLGRSRSDVLVGGETGVGRRTLARMIHHAAASCRGMMTGERRSGSLEVCAAFGTEAEEIRRIGASQDVATLAVSDLEWLAPEAQAALSELCAKPLGQRPRVIATMGSRDVVAAESGLHPHLLRQLGRVAVRCHPLRDRRQVIPALVEFLLRRMADREDGARLELDDAALAVLWRQPWTENITSLDVVLYGLFMRLGQGAHRGVVDGPGEESSWGQPAPAVEVGAEEVVAAILDVGLDVVPRLPSRAPRESDLLSALWATRTATRRINKTRAAFYLGWDPNTLAARLKDHGLASLEQVIDALRQGRSR